MVEIVRGVGSTPTEQHLAKIAERTFLNLWSYPNSFIDKKSHGVGDGKELCDLLVVFGDDVLIFSDKTIEWPENPDIAVSWKRWYKRAISKSVDQIRGAERWLREYPDRIYIDRGCTTKLPIDLPDLSVRRVHGIAIATGAELACKRYFGGDDGALMVSPMLKGSDHTTNDPATLCPFQIGDVDPDGPFVHVFDIATLDLVMRELDTVSDFVRYLHLRAEAVREGKILTAENEIEVLAFYLQSEDANGNHVFQRNGEHPDTVYFLSGNDLYQSLKQRPEYKAKVIANKISYTWDRLLNLFTSTVLEGASVQHPEFQMNSALEERGLRVMAAESRTDRRGLSEAFVGALERAECEKRERFARVVLSNSNYANAGTGYVFLFLSYPEQFELSGGYDQYRLVRASILSSYAHTVLMLNRKLKRVIGLAFDGRNGSRSGRGYSEDFMMVEVPDWTDEVIAEVEERRKFHDVLPDGRVEYFHTTVQEYPEIEHRQKLSRQQRRAMQRKAKKGRP